MASDMQCTVAPLEPHPIPLNTSTSVIINFALHECSSEKREGSEAVPSAKVSDGGPQVCIEGRPIASKIGAKSMFWSADGEAVKVEELALHYYASEDGGGWQGASAAPLMDCCICVLSQCTSPCNRLQPCQEGQYVQQQFFSKYLS